MYTHKETSDDTPNKNKTCGKTATTKYTTRKTKQNNT